MSLSTWLKEIFPGKPRWTAKDMPDLSGKVVCVTGGNTGIGYQTCKALLEHNAKVYLAARSEQKANAAIERLKQETGKNDVYWLKLDLADIPSCAAAAKELASKEKKLDILYNNAGVMGPPPNIKTAQGYEMQWGTNVVGHFVFTKELLPLLKAAAKIGHPNETRVVFTSSNGHNFAPKGIIDFDDPSLPKEGSFTRYGQSKAGNILQATYIANTYAEDGIMAFSLNPGGIRTEIQRHYPRFVGWLLGLFLQPVERGAINLLYAGTSPELTMKDSGKYFTPWAREVIPKKGTQDFVLAKKLWNYLEDETAGKY